MRSKRFLAFRMQVADHGGYFDLFCLRHVSYNTMWRAPLVEVYIYPTDLHDFSLYCL